MTIGHLVEVEKTVVNLHSPPEAVVERLVAQYASGALGSGMNVLMASLLTYNASLRNEYEDMVALQGIMLDDQSPEAMPNGALDRTLDAIDAIDIDDIEARDTQVDTDQPADRVVGGGNPDLPHPLKALLPRDITDLKWRFSYPGVQHVRLPVGDRDEDVRLLKIKPGRAAPRHTHSGFEATLVLRGAFRDGGQLYNRGEVSIGNSQVDHRPVAEGTEDCYCLAVTTGKLRVTENLRRLVRDFFN